MAGKNSETAAPDPNDVSRTLAELAEQARRVVEAYQAKRREGDDIRIPDPAVVAKAFLGLGEKLLADPTRLIESQARLMQGYVDLWQATAKRLVGEEAAPVAEPAAEDRRFKDAAWSDQVVFDFIKQSYLLAADWMQTTARDVDGLDPKTAEKVDFYTRQVVDALSPTNFIATNPQVLKATIDSKGQNLLKGLKNLLGDMETGGGRPAISMTDASAFTLGENVAASPGKIVFQNDLMQLIQFTPSTKQVHRRPLLLVPPWINKYYVLDLQPRNSLIKWLVDQGFTVFVVSWINPDETLGHKRFDDYMLEGPLAALGAIEKATGENEVNLIGYCIGGTLTAATLSYMAAKGDKRVVSATFLTTMVDFSEPGELGVFIDEEQLDNLDEHMAEKGFLEGRHMATVFNMMRDQDLIWSFVINNYLMGRDPMPFDLLYWNSDATRMPAMMHGYYLREMYLHNRLVEPGALSLDGQPIDLGRVKVPTYILSSLDDHIAPWKSTFAATKLYKGSTKFVLSGSGHIAGVINPPVAKKYCYWTNPKKAADPDVWIDGATRHDGSWWPDWGKWLARRGGGKVAARKPGAGKLKAIEDAPGSYVKNRLGG
jgi:polyhydroxyalkanoate synthase